MNVLILTDFSEVSDNAGKYAVDFLREKEADLYLLNIHELKLRKKNNPKLGEYKGIYAKLEKSINLLREYSKNPDHEFHPIFSSDNLINAIRMLLEKKKIELIFTGAVSNNVHHHPILGDHTYEVVRKIQCNIMAIPAGSTFNKLERLMLPVDYSVISRERVSNLLEHADFLKMGSLTIIELNEKSETEMKEKIGWAQEDFQLNSYKTRYLSMNETQIYSGNLLSEIQESFDMILILGKNLSVCDHFLHARYGLVSNFENSLPITVLHDC